jgi:hypothetical protein
MTVLLESIDKSRANEKTRRRRLFLSLLIAVVFALTIHPSQARAQIVGELEVNIPFQFHAGNTKLPAGKYLIHALDDADQTIMEISSADDSISALFEVQVVNADSTPNKSEVVFNKYGDRYFLAELLQEGNPVGSKVVESRYEKRISQAGAVAQEHAPARLRGQTGKLAARLSARPLEPVSGRGREGSRKQEL